MHQNGQEDIEGYSITCVKCIIKQKGLATQDCWMNCLDFLFQGYMCMQGVGRNGSTATH